MVALFNPTLWSIYLHMGPYFTKLPLKPIEQEKNKTSEAINLGGWGQLKSKLQWEVAYYLFFFLTLCFFSHLDFIHVVYVEVPDAARRVGGHLWALCGLSDKCFYPATLSITWRSDWNRKHLEMSYCNTSVGILQIWQCTICDLRHLIVVVKQLIDLGKLEVF